MQINPLIFKDGSEFFEAFSKKYRTHDKGLFIVAPSGTGKTYFCKRQEYPDWIDGDELWMSSGAHPDFAWWNEPLEVINRVDNRSDIITMEAKAQGFWIMGASNLWLKPDAIVIPDWETHKSYIAEREKNHYDGGATSDKLDQVKEHIDVIKKWHDDYDVPQFASIQEAVNYLTKDNS